MRILQSLKGEAQPYLPHVTPRVKRTSVHAKFHADWTKTDGARGIQTDGQTDRQSDKQTNNLVSCKNDQSFDDYCRSGLASSAETTPVSTPKGCSPETKSIMSSASGKGSSRVCGQELFDNVTKGHTPHFGSPRSIMYKSEVKNASKLWFQIRILLLLKTEIPQLFNRNMKSTE